MERNNFRVESSLFIQQIINDLPSAVSDQLSAIIDITDASLRQEKELNIQLE